MIIGLDFDNTIVCYDKAIATLAESHFDLPSDFPRTKLAIRDHLRSAGREEAWTRFQGELYGPGMAHAEPFPHAIEIIRELSDRGHRLAVISHRTRFPYLGERHDLHAHARGWIDEHLPHVLSSIVFHEMKAAKIDAIGLEGCDLFVDDLPEILLDPQFPASTRGVLFAPGGDSPDWHGTRIDSWVGLKTLALAGEL